jgi:hypothetical protein
MANPEAVIAQVVTIDDATPTPLVAPAECSGLTVYPKTFGVSWQFRTRATRPWVRLLNGADYTFGDGGRGATRPGGSAYEAGNTAAELMLPAGGPATAEMYALWRPRWVQE